MPPRLNQYRQHINLGLRFLFSGGIATLAHWLSMWLLVRNGVEPTLATTMGALLGAVVNYFMQYHFTFNSQRAHTTAVASYVASVAVSTGTNGAVFYLIYNFLIHQAAVSQVLTTGLVMVLNFTLYKWVVFRGSK